MSYIRGRRNNAKLIATSWTQVQAAEGEYCIKLTQGQVLALVSQLQFLRWLTRWTDSPTQEEISTFTDELESRLIVACDCTDCDAVALCITENQGVRDSLNRWFRDTEYAEQLQRALEALESLETGYVRVLDQCDEDRIFGSITAVFDELNQSAVDFLEILEASSNITEMIYEWSEAIAAAAIASGGAAIVAAGVIIAAAQTTEEFLDDLIANYNAAYTTELRDELRCEFFCYAQDQLDCGFSASDILVWLESQIDFSSITLVELVDWFFGLTTSLDRLTVLYVWYLELALMRFAITNTLASFFVGQPARNAVTRLIRVATASEPDNDWTVFCDVCPSDSWEQEWDFTVSDGGWSRNAYCANNFVGVYVAAVGWSASGGLRNAACVLRPNWRIVDIGRDISTGVANVTRVEIDYTSVRGSGYTSIQTFLTPTALGNTTPVTMIEDVSPLPLPNGLKNNVWNGDTPLDRARFRVRIWASETAGNGSATITRIRVVGTGVNPFL